MRWFLGLIYVQTSSEHWNWGYHNQLHNRACRSGTDCVSNVNEDAHTIIVLAVLAVRAGAEFQWRVALDTCGHGSRWRTWRGGAPAGDLAPDLRPQFPLSVAPALPEEGTSRKTAPPFYFQILFPGNGCIIILGCSDLAFEVFKNVNFHHWTRYTVLARKFLFYFMPT